MMDEGIRCAICQESENVVVMAGYSLCTDHADDAEKHDAFEHPLWFKDLWEIEMEDDKP